MGEVVSVLCYHLLSEADKCSRLSGRVKTGILFQQINFIKRNPLRLDVATKIAAAAYFTKEVPMTDLRFCTFETDSFIGNLW